MGTVPWRLCCMALFSLSSCLSYVSGFFSGACNVPALSAPESTSVFCFYIAIVFLLYYLCPLLWPPPLCVGSVYCCEGGLLAG